jgi:nicotinate-nucleotide--dimethylbenzimidazole phosphoribosyltransferase
MGQLLDLAIDIAGITRTLTPMVKDRLIVVMGADHGVHEEGVTPCPQEITVQQMRNFVQGGAGINAMAHTVGAHVAVVDMGTKVPMEDLVRQNKIIEKRIGCGTANMAKGHAMTREEAVASIESGIAVARQFSCSCDIFGTGEMGICNTTPSSAILSVITGAPVADVTGRGSGLDDEGLKNKISIIEKSIKLNQPDKNDAIDILAKVGGFEIGGIAGLILGAAALRKPVVIDGFISTAGAILAHKLCPESADYMISSHKSVEVGHRIMLDILGKKPLLDLDLRLGEGTGAALAMNLVEASVRLLVDVKTFEEASVSRNE